MGYEKLSGNDRMALVGMAQMAHGSGWFEGTSGGRGHMGLIKTSDGRERVIKFDTHGGTSGGDAAKTSSDNLRKRLWDIASKEESGLSPEVLAEIRAKLGITETGVLLPNQKILKRTIAAQVLTMIGGKELWEAARTGFNKEGQATNIDDPSTFDGKTVSRRRMVEIGGSGFDAKMKSRTEDLKMFFNDVDQWRHAGVKYVRLGANQDKLDLEESPQTNHKLENAGRRYILRNLSDKEDNDRVHRVFARAILAHFDGKIPRFVQELMTNFTGGHPLSVDRIALLREAITLADFIGGDLPLGLSFKKASEALKAVSMNVTDFKAAIESCGEKFNLTTEQKRAVARTTLAYLASRSEGVKEGRAILNGKAEANVTQEIENGRLEGTRAGLWSCGALRTGDCYKPTTENSPFNGSAGTFVAHRPAEDAEFLTWCDGQFKSLDASPIMCMGLLERKEEILKYAKTHESFGVKELYTIFLKEEPESDSTRKNYEQGLMDEIKSHILEEALEKLPSDISGDSSNQSFVDTLEFIMRFTGVGLQNALDVYQNGWKNDLPLPRHEISGGSQGINDVVKKVSRDGGSKRQNATVKIGQNDSLQCEENEESTAYAEKVRSQMRNYLATYGNVSEKQLIAALHCCTQEVDDFKRWFANVNTGPRSFLMLGNGVLQYQQAFTACGLPHVIRFEIDQEGVIRLVELHQGDVTAAGETVEYQSAEPMPPKNLLFDELDENWNWKESETGDEGGVVKSNTTTKKKPAKTVLHSAQKESAKKVADKQPANLDGLLKGLTKENVTAVIREFADFARANPGKNVKVFDWRELADGKVRLGPTTDEGERGGHDLEAEEANNMARKILLAAIEKLYPNGEIPQGVRQEMTYFGVRADDAMEGRPLSSDCIGKICAAIANSYAQMPVRDLVTKPYFAEILSDTMKTYDISDAGLAQKMSALEYSVAKDGPSWKNLTSPQTCKEIRQIAKKSLETNVVVNVMVNLYAIRKNVENIPLAKDVNRSSRITVFGKAIVLKNGVRGASPGRRAVDELAKAFLGQPDATYDGLDERNRKLVDLLTCFLNQSFKALPAKGVGPIYDAFIIPSRGETAGAYEVSWTKDGGIRFSYNYIEKINQLSTILCKTNLAGVPLDGDKSFMVATVSAEYDANQLEQLLKLDFGELDASKFQKPKMREDDFKDLLNKESRLSGFNIMPKVDYNFACRFVSA